MSSRKPEQCLVLQKAGRWPRSGIPRHPDSHVRYPGRATLISTRTLQLLYLFFIFIFNYLFAFIHMYSCTRYMQHFSYSSICAVGLFFLFSFQFYILLTFPNLVILGFSAFYRKLGPPEYKNYK